MPSLSHHRVSRPGYSMLALLAASLLLAPSPSPAEPRRLDDDTQVDSWTLANGLQVVTRDVAGAAGVSVTVAYGFGSELDPPGREGWSTLLAHVAFLSAAGEYPERTLDALPSSRPLGWRVEVGRRYSRLTEVASTAQFPGVLHEMAVRMRAPAPSAKLLAATRKAVQAQLAASYRDRVELALHYGIRDAEAAERAASGKGLDRVTLPMVHPALATWYVPANAVLSLAGNLSGSGIDLRRVIANEFGTMPGGKHATVSSDTSLSPGARVVERTGLPYPIGVIGVIAPALADTAHPSFYIHALVVGAALVQRWGRSDLVPAPFQYSLLDEPELVRIYPPITMSDVDSSRIREEYQEALIAVSNSTITFEDFRDLHDGVLWLLGGPLTLDLRQRAKTDSGVLATLSTTAAMRALWGGDSFWSGYLARFTAIDRPVFARWSAYFLAPEHQLQLLFMPATAGPKKKG